MGVFRKQDFSSDKGYIQSDRLIWMILFLWCDATLLALQIFRLAKSFRVMSHQLVMKKRSQNRKTTKSVTNSVECQQCIAMTHNRPLSLKNQPQFRLKDMSHQSAMKRVLKIDFNCESQCDLSNDSLLTSDFGLSGSSGSNGSSPNADSPIQWGLNHHFWTFLILYILILYIFWY